MGLTNEEMAHGYLLLLTNEEMGEAGLAAQSASQIELTSILQLDNADARKQCGCNNLII